MAKKTPEINSSSTADIAFLLLCYFLMTTTMGDQSGLQRRLPPIPDSKQAQDQKVNRRNIVIVRINSADKLFAGNEAMDIAYLKDKMKEFLANPNNDPNLPEKEEKEIEGKTYMVSKGVISLQNDRTVFRKNSKTSSRRSCLRTSPRPSRRTLVRNNGGMNYV